MKHNLLEEFAEKIKIKVEQNIENAPQSIHTSQKLIKNFDTLRKYHLKNGLSPLDDSFKTFEELLEYGLLLEILYLDLSSATIAYLNSKSTYEKLYSTRQIIVIINEGYKQIYNFTYTNNKGHIVTKHRNGSYWYGDIRVIIEELIPEFKCKYDSLTKKLDNYFKANFESIKEQRDLTVHYDKKASKVYDMIFELDVNEVFKKLFLFLDIIKEMFLFNLKVKVKFFGIVVNLFIKESEEYDILYHNYSSSDTEKESINKYIEFLNRLRADSL